jgi:predicted DNA-binding transcriptional regulator AlpA
MRSERRLRVPEFAELVGYKPSTIRKKILRPEIAYHKIGRIIAIPESEAEKLLRDFRPSIQSCKAKEEAD